MQSTNTKLSVIIPTYNRAVSLHRVLEGLLNQTYQDFEVIVVDDGSVDETQSVVKGLMEKALNEIAYVRQENRGAGSARNAGIRHAKGDVVLFIDDDVLPASNLLEEHIGGHERHRGDNIAILGPVFYAPELEVSHFMRWLIDRGPHFFHSRAEDGAQLDYRYFCTANISLSRGFMLEKGLFDEQFRPFFEDIELGFRLQQHGLQIILNKSAIGYHLRGETFQGYCERSIWSGQSAVKFYTKWPAAAPAFSPSTSNTGSVIRRIGRKLVMRSLIPGLKPLICWLDTHGCAVPSYFYAVVSHYYSQIGLRKGLEAIENRYAHQRY